MSSNNQKHYVVVFRAKFRIVCLTGINEAVRAGHGTARISDTAVSRSCIYKDTSLSQNCDGMARLCKITINILINQIVSNLLNIYDDGH